MQMTDLSLAIVGFIEDGNCRDIAAVTACFKADAVVEDEGRTYRGVEEIRGWVQRTQTDQRYKRSRRVSPARRIPAIRRRTEQQSAFSSLKRDPELARMVGT